MRKGMISVILLSLIIGGAVPSVASAATLYYSTYVLGTTGSQYGQIWSVDTPGGGGQAFVMGVPQVDGFNKLMDMAPARLRDTFYVSLYNYTTPTASRLLIINTALQTSDVVGEFGHPVRQLALDRLNNVLYGAGGEPNVPNLGNADENFYVVDMGTGAATLIGPFDPVNNSIRKMVGLGYDPNNDTIYGTDSLLKQLFTINKATGQATLVGSTGVCIFDIYFDPGTQAMYGVGSPNAQLPFYFYSINLATGLATQISPLATADYAYGLAGYLFNEFVPANTNVGLLVFSLLLLAVAFVVLRRKRVA